MIVKTKKQTSGYFNTIIRVPRGDYMVQNCQLQSHLRAFRMYPKDTKA